MLTSDQKRYLRHVKRHLSAPRFVRNKLISGLATELAESGNACPSEPPEETAAVLMESIAPEARSSYRKRKTVVIGALIAAFVGVLLLSWAFFYYVESSQIARAEGEIVYEAIYE